MPKSFVFSSESVGEGHPDKVADLISDSVLDACLAQDPSSRVACETLVKSNQVVIAGEITTKAKLNYELVVRDAIRDIGYTNDDDDNVTDGFKLAYPKQTITIEAAQGPIPIAESIDPTSPNFMHWYDPDVSTTSSVAGCATDPVVLRNLRAVAEHVDAEVAGDIDRLMATLVSEPVYHIWGASKSVGPQGFDEVCANYQSLIRSGKNRLSYEVTRVVADARCVVTEGHFRFAYPGAVLPCTTLSTGKPILDDHWYLVEYKCVVLWPVDDQARIVGEELYAGEALRVVQHLDDGEHPELGPVGRCNGVLVPGWVR